MTDVSQPFVPEQHSAYWFAWKRFLRNRGAVVSGIVLGSIIIVALFAPLLTPWDPNAQLFLTDALAFPSQQHWFGIDNIGRDFFTRVIHGARVSLSIGFFAATASIAIGIPLGALAGYYGGWADWLVMRVIEIFSVVPPLLAALLLVLLTGGGFLSIVIIAALFSWVQVALLVRVQIKSLREKDFIRAARALGASPAYIIRRHLIPNAISAIIVGFVMSIPLAMMLEASLSFLGVGMPPPTPTWGQMINDGIDYMFYYWHMPIFPTLALAITVLTTSLLGDGLRDAFDPTQKEGGA